MRIAAVQLTSGGDVKKNLAAAEASVEEAAARGAQLAVLPENTAYVGSPERAPAPEELDGPYVRRFQALAQRLGIALVAGSFAETGAQGGRTYNTSPLIGAGGELLAVYRKLHLYDVEIPGRVSARESATVAPGGELVVGRLSTPEGAPLGIGMAICYDLRFPELFRALTTRGAQLLTLPAEFRTHTGKDHWLPLLKARAIENQCYVVASGQVGDSGTGRLSYGRSAIIDPWGTVLAVAPDYPSVITAELDLAYLESVRENMPCLAHRRLVDGGFEAPDAPDALPHGGERSEPEA